MTARYIIDADFHYIDSYTAWFSCHLSCNPGRITCQCIKTHDNATWRMRFSFVS